MRDGRVSFTRIDPRGGEPFVVARDVEVNSQATWDLSPSGDEMAFLRMGRLVALATTDGASRLDVLVDRPPLTQYLSYQGSGRSFIATRVSGDVPKYTVVRIDREGHASLLWDSGSGWLSFPVVSPDGRHVAIKRDDDAQPVAPRPPVMICTRPAHPRIPKDDPRGSSREREHAI